MCHRQAASAQEAVDASTLLGVPKCREGLSEVIASVVFFFGVRDGSDECQTYGVKCTHLLALFHNLVKTIIVVNQSPVIHLAMFQDSLNNVTRRFVHRHRRYISIPEQILGKVL
jgi:hypothetical protein